MDIKYNNKWKYNDSLNCVACNQALETQEHIFKCSILVDANHTSSISDYYALFGDNMLTQVFVAKC